MAAGYPGYIPRGSSSITFPGMGATGVGGGVGNMLKIRQKYRKIEGWLISNFFFRC